jgi:hypothetical protein
MGTLTISASGFTNGPNGSKAYAVSDADWLNLISYMQVKFTPNPTNENPIPVEPTPAQALLAWAQDWVIQTRNEIRSTQQITAQKAAADAVNVPPIVFG